MKSKIFSIFPVIILLVFSAKSGADRRDEKTVITGNEIQIINGGGKVVYSGNSKAVKGADMLKADKIIQDRNSKILDAEGNVYFITYNEEKEKVVGSANDAEFNSKTGKGRLWNGKPELKYYTKTSTGPIELDAQTIDFDQKKSEIFAKGNVVILSSSATAYSPQALCRQKDKQIFLTGPIPQPRVIFIDNDKKGDFNGDRVTVYTDKKKMYFDGNVNGKIFLPDKD